MSSMRVNPRCFVIGISKRLQKHKLCQWREFLIEPVEKA